MRRSSRFEADSARTGSMLHPALRPPPRRSRFLIVLGMALLIIAGLTGTALRTLTARYDGTVTKERLLDPDARQAPEEGTVSGPLNYLLIGSDRRSRNPDAGERADTIMIAHIPKSLNRGYLISVPRDLLVQIPPHPPSG
ncbi:MAG TPA: hypothetical protein VF174_10255, partial [Micromonosporaceae bacterium]